MSDFSNPPEECMVCNQEYDVLQTVDETSEFQTQGKANVCVAHHPKNGTFLFFHFTEKYL